LTGDREDAGFEIQDAIATLRERLGDRGWKFKAVKGTIRARMQDWPSQLELLIDPGAERAPRLGLLLGFHAMPMGGERLRDIFNSDRENVLGRYGTFQLRQVNAESQWLPPVTSGAFMHGFGSNSGISRQAHVVLFDREPSQRGIELVEHFVEDIGRYTESGNTVAFTLQRVYQRTVLAGNAPAIELPEDHPPEEKAPAGEYPWRR
jgi:hypothetical protein